MDRLIDIYKTTLQSQIMTELSIKNIHDVPRLEKVVVNIGLGDARGDQKKVDKISKILMTVTGQKPTMRKARKSIAGFKLRAGEVVGLSLTLRGKRMYDFIERVIRIVLPRVRDFHGIARKSLDGKGNLTIGLKEMSVFPEIRYEDLDVAHGMELTIVTTAKTDESGEKLLAGFGIPFAKS